MTDVTVKIENISFLLNELREGHNIEAVTRCLEELEDMKKGIRQKSLIPSFEEQENKLLEHYEGKYKEAQRIIISLEKELEELKSKGYQFEQSNHSILSKKSIFSKDQENVDPNSTMESPAKEGLSYSTVKNLLHEMEFKSLQNEKENEYDKSQIKELKALTSEYEEQIENLITQLEELKTNLETSETKVFQLGEEKKKMAEEISQLKAEAEFFKNKIEDLEKDIQAKNSSISMLEVKMKAAEDKQIELVTSLNDLETDNKTLKQEKEEIAEKYQTAYNDFKEKTLFHHKSSPETKKIFNSFSHYYKNAPNFPQDPAKNKEKNIPRNVEDFSKSTIILHPTKESHSDAINSEGKFDEGGNTTAQHIEEYVALSNFVTIEDNDGMSSPINDYCRSGLSVRTKSLLSSVHEENTQTKSVSNPFDKEISPYKEMDKEEQHSYRETEKEEQYPQREIKKEERSFNKERNKEIHSSSRGKNKDKKPDLNLMADEDKPCCSACNMF